MRMLDNVIDINYYAVAKARNSNLQASPGRPGHHGLPGLPALPAHAVRRRRKRWSSPTAVDGSVCYYAYWRRPNWPQERGRYPSYRGSPWDRGILPQDSLKLLAEAARRLRRSRPISSAMDWTELRARIAQLRHAQLSNCVAIAPTATISNIIGVSAVDRADVPEPVCEVEPVGRIHRGQRLSGARPEGASDLWDEVDGRRSQVLRRLAVADRPHSGRTCAAIYATAFEVDRNVAGRMRRASPEVDRPGAVAEYLYGRADGASLNEMYLLGWQKGLKTTYYLRTLAATQIEKSTLDVNRFGIQPKWMKNRSTSSDMEVRRSTVDAAMTPACKLDDPDCEACQ